jgi:hypothetical protein
MRATSSPIPQLDEEASEGSGDGVLGGGVFKGLGRTEGGKAISWMRWARRFDSDGPLVEGEGEEAQTCTSSS